MLGLVASMVLRCDDCISYHVAQCGMRGEREEFFEIFSVGLVVGGSIVIPHLRRAVDFLDQLENGVEVRRLSSQLCPLSRWRERVGVSVVLLVFARHSREGGNPALWLYCFLESKSFRSKERVTFC